MKKIIFILALLPLSAFASDEANPNTYALNNKCANATDPAERKDCLAIEKKSEAQENYKNFQENHHSQYQEDF